MTPAAKGLLWVSLIEVKIKPSKLVGRSCFFKFVHKNSNVNGYFIKHPRDGVCRRRIPILLQPRKASPLVELVLLPSRCEELSLPSLFLDLSFPLLHCSLFEVPLDLISGHICSICVVTALGVRKTQVKGEPQFLCKHSSLFDERLMSDWWPWCARTSLIVESSLLYSWTCWFLPEVAGHAGLKIGGTRSSPRCKKHARKKWRRFVFNCSLGRPTGKNNLLFLY